MPDVGRVVGDIAEREMKGVAGFKRKDCQSYLASNGVTRGSDSVVQAFEELQRLCLRSFTNIEIHPLKGP